MFDYERAVDVSRAGPGQDHPGITPWRGPVAPVAVSRSGLHGLGRGDHGVPS